jgi:phosphoribosylanthranilate isomerase
MRTRVKICGITRIEDARAAAAAGADAIGMVFYAPSPRHVAVDRAVEIARCLPPFVTRVGLFVDAPRETVEAVVERVGIELVQFHGDETPEACGACPRPYLKAVRMRQGTELHAVRERYRDAAGLLLDAYQPGRPGGTGATFDWNRIPADIAGEIVLAGGLTAENVTEAVVSVRPFAVDVSGGVERRKGIKDPEKIKRFIRGVELGDQQNALD